MNFLYIFIYINVLSMVSCLKHDVSAKEYARLVTDSTQGLRKVIRHNKITFLLQYEPIDYLCLIERNSNSQAQDLDKLRQDYAGLMHFIFSIESTDHKTSPLKFAVNEMDNEALVSCLAFDIKSDLFIIWGTDTLPCLIEHLQSNYGLVPRLDILLGFKERHFSNDDTVSQFSLFYSDHVYATGLNSFSFLRHDIQKVSLLKPSL